MQPFLGSGEKAEVICEEEVLHSGIPGVVSPLLFRENVVDIDVEEHGAHGASLAQATLQGEGLRYAVTNSDAHYRVGVEFADEVIYLPIDTIEA